MPDFEFPAETMAGRIERRLAEMKRSAASVSEEATGKKDAIRKIFTKARKGEDFNPRMDTLQELSRVLDRSVVWLTDGGGDVTLSAPIEADPVPPSYGGTVQAGRFRPVDEYFNQDEDWNVPPGVVRHPAYPRVRQYVWQARGDSMTEAGILDGMWIVGADAGDWADQYGEIESGDLVVVQHTRHDGAERELTVKEIRFYRDRSELLPRSKNPEHKPVVVKFDHARDDGEEVKVIGLVLWAGFDFREKRR